MEEVKELKKDWLSFFQKDWFQAAVFFILLFTVLTFFEVVDNALYGKVVLTIIGSVFVDDALSSFGKQ
jgi:hypothetical protein